VRYKEVSEAEDEANRKVLHLLDEVANLTRENQELLQGTTESQDPGFYYDGQQVESQEEIVDDYSQSVTSGPKWENNQSHSQVSYSVQHNWL